MNYLGVQFDTIGMKMSIPPEKVAEVTEDLSCWVRKTSETKKSLQQLLGKLFWISRCVQFSRPFMGNLLVQLQRMYQLPANKKAKLSPDSKEDIKWWARYIRRFNGV